MEVSSALFHHDFHKFVKLLKYTTTWESKLLAGWLCDHQCVMLYTKPSRNLHVNSAVEP